MPARFVVASVLLGFVGCSTQSADTGPGLRRARSIAMTGAPTLAGRIDHLAYDPATQRLFVACIEAGALAVLDLETGAPVAAIRDLQEPRGVAVAPLLDGTSRVFVACGGDHVLRAFDTRTLEPKGSVLVGADADNVHWDASLRLVHVGTGAAQGGTVTEVDPETLRVVRRNELAAHAEGFALDPDGVRLFVNVPGAKQAENDGAVVVADRRSATVEATWRLRGAARNFAIAYVRDDKLVLTACRQPAVLIALDAASGAELARVPCIEDADDVCVDAANRRAFVVGGAGGVDVIAMPARGQLRRIATVALPPRARTALFVPERRALYVAVPARSGAAAEVLEFLAD